MRHGSCLCGAVTFAVEGQPRDVLLCHCTQCRQTSGHFWAAAGADHGTLTVTKGDALVWFQSSAKARRGFCGECGSSLFWEEFGGDHISFAPGALDGPTGMQVIGEWHLADAGDYYTAPQPSGEVLECGCLCGSVRFRVPGPAGDITACHCTQCRKYSGHFAASFDVAESAVEWIAKGALREFASAGGGQRGFCGACGSGLYFRKPEQEFNIEAGAVKGPTGGRLAAHIFVADKGDYYQITDGLPQHPGDLPLA
jgi:hypothetical protein